MLCSESGRARSAATAAKTGIPSNTKLPDLLGHDWAARHLVSARRWACNQSVAPQAASCSGPNKDPRASLCERLAASSKWQTTLPALRQLPRRM
eukprot:3074846-Pyramimonas_sp.AAC.1